jgi:hypothetical protein
MGIPPASPSSPAAASTARAPSLAALAWGVYDHPLGDGRELVVTRPDAVTIRAEDGRGVTGVDISAMIGELPGGRRTDDFSTPNASGSTSQAANIAEALEIGTSLLLVDEDTSATNSWSATSGCGPSSATNRSPPSSTSSAPSTRTSASPPSSSSAASATTSTSPTASS